MLERNPWIGGAAVSREIEKAGSIQLLVRVQPLAPRAVPRPGAGAPRPAGGAIRRRRNHHQHRRHPRQLHGSRHSATRVRASQRARRRRVRPLLHRRDAAVQVHPTAAAALPFSRSHFTAAAGLREIRFSFSAKDFNKYGEQFIYDTMRFYYDEHRRSSSMNTSSPISSSVTSPAAASSVPPWVFYSGHGLCAPASLHGRR